MTRTIYSCKTEIALNSEGYRISKFVDGEVESSYITTTRECDCPAGHRQSCRHRQMLPQMMAAGIVNTHYFWDFDLHRAVDFNGTLKSNFDAMNELAVEHVVPPAEPIVPAGPLTLTEAAGPPAEPNMHLDNAAWDELVTTGTTMTTADGKHIPQRSWRRL